MGNRLRLAVFVSGSGTNLQSMLDRSAGGRLDAEVVVVVSDRPDAYGIERARRRGIPTYVVDYAHYLSDEPARGEEPPELEDVLHESRAFARLPLDLRRRRCAAYIRAEKVIAEIVRPYRVDYICLAGFMRLLTPHFLRQFVGGGEFSRVINIHPALLPAFPGRHGYEETFGFGCRWGGVSVHFVDEGEDTGPLIAQAVYPIFPHDTIEAVRRRGLRLEYEVYAQSITWLANGMVTVTRRDGSERPVVVIEDPAYGEILRRWISLALSDET